LYCWSKDTAFGLHIFTRPQCHKHTRRFYRQEERTVVSAHVPTRMFLCVSAVKAFIQRQSWRASKRIRCIFKTRRLNSRQ
jgi:hypothetical protein